MPGIGQSSSTTQTSNSTTPWATAMPTVNSLFSGVNGLIPGSTSLNGAQQGAVNTLEANGAAGNPYAPAMGTAATSLLNGGGANGQNGNLSTNLTNFTNGMSTYTDPNYSTLNTPAVQNALNQVGQDTTDQINSQFAAAGRSGSGENAQTVARGVAQAEAPLILNQANTDTATRENALNSVYGAGNTTAGQISTNNQNADTNMENGITAGNSAYNANNAGALTELQAGQYAATQPTTQLGALANIGIPLSQLGTNSSGTSNTTTNPSMLSELTGLGGLFSGGANSAVSGMANFGGGLLNGLGGLLAL